MIFQFALILSLHAVAWVTAANSLAVYSRQSTNVECAEVPTRCSEALKNYTQSVGLGPFLRCAGTQSARDLILQVTCARDEDGNFCLSKVIREVERFILNWHNTTIKLHLDMQ